MIPLQYEGPYSLLKPLYGGNANEVFCRYGSSSARSSERDLHRMENDWASWFLDCRYEKNANSLIALLAKRFPRHTALTQLDQYVRLVYESSVSDDFGTHLVPKLVHAYWGFEPIGPAAIENILQDNSTATFQKVIIGARFSGEARARAAESAVF